MLQLLGVLDQVGTLEEKNKKKNWTKVVLKRFRNHCIRSSRSRKNMIREISMAIVETAGKLKRMTFFLLFWCNSY